ncbi:MAG: LysR family transcriptional regulator [Hydrogenophaga sp.]|uniref:LysR family transcriptional regulator n=1 Tax=Hydrogenophaga sp. TaxID=1904254 RepID=UPI00257C5C77|nr:LysR family transcriptional regulator [Hydrogenophaga sp.]MBL0946126.1 LysR family transcriptional regulator [Hydrogenophaga sp.]
MGKILQPGDFGFFAALANAGSLSAAAREMGISTAAVSRHLSQMESRLGLALINRTTRRMSLTPEGEVYLDFARKIQGDMDELEDRLSGASLAPQGLLRVNATLGFGRSHIAPLISQFCRQQPKVDVQLQLSVNPPPITEDLYDVCFRFGTPPDSRSIARFIAPNRRILVASPAYLKKYGQPKTPEDLTRHNCIGIRQGDEAYGLWRFTSPKVKLRGQPNPMHSVKVQGNLTTNDGGVAVAWALDGHGILLRAEWDVRQYVKAKRLVEVLPAYASPDADIYAIYAERHRTSLRVRALVDFVASAFEKEER